ncbi:hypothetical protein ELE36_06100 [Pseudolysobacter antarcticus]|uniref:Uncharacterized protein n=1 Tax=Pseudolysobacter antarcticus TaxID=2511995 RepID=A0A411HHU7_9GAMM|nr:hypothetical protein [Pseudolysobacter antarcticus]QBB69967.1 hypothetical protein ELE36_06100 [Pseudolysobacter antarcticus]
MKTISEKLLFPFAVVISAWVVLTSAYLCYLSPQRAWPYGLALAVICIAWAVYYFDAGDRNKDATLSEPRRKHLLAIVFSGLLLSNALSIKLMAQLGWSGGFASELGERSLGFLMGAIVVVLANAIPKKTSSARGLVVLRIAGWALVLGGAGYALALLVLPLPYANDAALLVLLAATIYGATRVVWLSVKHRSLPPSCG